jgi:ABC-type Zn2+ transport system substrate-binding protein/surface adhesin
MTARAMNADAALDGAGHAPVHDHAHHHEHDHAAGHAHPHTAGHVHAAHAHAPSLLLRTHAPARVTSLLMSSALLRLAGAVGLSALLWTAVVWALAGVA